MRVKEIKCEIDKKYWKYIKDLENSLRMRGVRSQKVIEIKEKPTRRQVSREYSEEEVVRRLKQVEEKQK